MTAEAIKSTNSTLVGASLQVYAVSGLERSHTDPFVRIVNADPHRSEKASVAIESHAQPLARSRDRQRGRYTVCWGEDNDQQCTFDLPANTDFVELQLWHKFPNGFDVFLAQTKLSLEQIRRQLGVPCLATDRQATGSLWIPLQLPNDQKLNLRLSAQVVVTFLYDVRAARIREQISSKPTASERSDQETPSNNVADPAFALTPPFVPVEWSVLAATSIRHLFFYNDVKRLERFREQVLYGDVAHEMQEDENLQVHDNHLKAFQLSQFAAQYLDHCVDKLESRIGEYSEQYQTLHGVMAELKHKNRSLHRQRKRLQREHQELELLLGAYERVGQKKSDPDHVDSTTSPIHDPARPFALAIDDAAAAPENPHHEPMPYSPPPSSPLSAKKPAFLKTWEEREQERQLEKERTKAKRIEEEQKRLKQRLDERAACIEDEARRAISVDHMRKRAASRIQHFIRQWMQFRVAKKQALAARAASVIQTKVRQHLCRVKYPELRERLRQARETRMMAESERDSHCLSNDPKLPSTSRERQSLTTATVGQETGIESATSLSPLHDVVEALVTTWREVRRVLIKHRRATDFRSIFARMDARKDGLIDRAEFRLGLRSFGVHLDRKLTRALISLARGKAGAPSRPLLLSYDQFIRGFDLTGNEAASASSMVVDQEHHLHEPDRHPINNGVSNLDAGVNKHRNTMDPSCDTNIELDIPLDPLEEAEKAVRALRNAMYEAATIHLKSLGRVPTNYIEFRDALAHVFARFDADGSGQLDMTEFAACMQSIGVPTVPSTLALVRECFSGDEPGDGITIADFISFVLQSSATDSSKHQEELGILGFRVRTAILDKVTSLRAQAESVEAAVRLAFRSAYGEKKRSCSIREFGRALTSFGLRLKLPQVARLAVRLDRDGDGSISFDELLVWLRLQSAASITPVATAVVNSENVARSGFQATLAQATSRVRELQELIWRFAATTGSDDNRARSLTALFSWIDRNKSGKITQNELEVFLALQDLSSLSDIKLKPSKAHDTSSPKPRAVALAKEMMTILDCSGNGVVTLDEWLDFGSNDPSKTGHFAEIFAVRTELRAFAGNESQTLSKWFLGLPGVMESGNATGNDGDRAKIRVGEFKQSLRKALGGSHVATTAVVDITVKLLDADSSGWITTRELLQWVFPPRDLEEVLRLVHDCWHTVRDANTNQSFEDFCIYLYRRFDLDGNDCLAHRELVQGFASFGLRFSDAEVQTLVRAFDSNGDGIWSKGDFMKGFVTKIFGTASTESSEQVFSAASLSTIQPISRPLEEKQTRAVDENMGVRSEEALSASSSFASEHSEGSPLASLSPTRSSQMPDYADDFEESDTHY